MFFFIDTRLFRVGTSIPRLCQISTSCTACSAAATICHRPLQVMSWTTTRNFQLGGNRTYTPTVYQVWNS